MDEIVLQPQDEEQAEESAAAEEEQADGKALKKTYQEFREEARRAILSGHDRENYETLEPDEREFVDAACLFEFQSQQVNRSKRKVKLREILLCRDVALAYGGGKDPAGQYSEGRRILKNSESGSETVKYVLARKVCSMLERIHNIYSSHPRSYVGADLHRAESALLNYTARLGKIIHDPLAEARKIYVKLKERTGWEIPPTAFGKAEGCDVPQLFFNRYSDSNQLLLKDPLKPFRSDNLNPPLVLDFRIKNAVLVMAGENRFYLDRKKYSNLKDSATVRAIALKDLAEVRRRISEAYSRNTFDLAEGLGTVEGISIQSIKEAAFGFFYGYTLTDLSKTAARADAAELFALGLMEAENDIGCPGFCRWLFPPEAVDDADDPEHWGLGRTKAFKLRDVFHQLATGKLRLAMFSTSLNSLLTEYLDGQLKAMLGSLAAPFDRQLTEAERRYEHFYNSHKEQLLKSGEIEESLEQLQRRRGELSDKSLELFNQAFGKSVSAGSAEEKWQLAGRLLPKLEEEAAVCEKRIAEVKERYKSLVESHNNLAGRVKKIDSLAGKSAEPGYQQALLEVQQELFALFSDLSPELKHPDNPAGLRSLAVEQSNRIRQAIEKLKERHASLAKAQKSLQEIIQSIRQTAELSAQIEPLKKEHEVLNALYLEKQALVDKIDQIKAERDECLSRIEDLIEANLET